jgi:succinoglycan biosynthesis transport protein ExoP
LRDEASAARRALVDEIIRTQRVYRDGYEAARSRWEAATRALEQELERSGQTHHAVSRLRELEAAAHEARTLYDEFVQRGVRESQRPNIPMTHARVITQASPPRETDQPQLAAVLALGLAAGLGAGLGAGVVRDLLNRSVRSRRQLERASGLPCLAMLPRLRTGPIRRAKPRPSDGGREIVPRLREFEAAQPSPTSDLTEGLRTLKLAIDLHLAGNGGIALGIASSLPGEGTTTLSANLAFHLARNGERVLLVDCDLKDSGLSARLASNEANGLRDVLVAAEPDVDSLVWFHPETGLHLLPAGHAGGPQRSSSGLLGSPAMERFLSAARSRYDYIVLDLPPLLPFVDGRGAAHRLDALLVVTAWNDTPQDAVWDAVSLSSAVRTKAVGAVLNKVKARALGSISEGPSTT